jgi:hypothetical protein
MPRFILEIELGNDAMRSDSDIAECIRDVATRVERFRVEPKNEIRDINGNTVGHYEVGE